MAVGGYENQADSWAGLARSRLPVFTVNASMRNRACTHRFAGHENRILAIRRIAGESPIATQGPGLHGIDDLGVEGVLEHEEAVEFPALPLRRGQRRPQPPASLPGIPPKRYPDAASA